MKAHLPQLEKTKYKISACMIAKNEEKNIATCIDSVRDFADEIVVVDTGSQDDTVKLAKEHGAKVGYFEWCNDFAAAKNAALDMVTGDWIVFLDADEYFSPDCGDKVREAISIAEESGKNALGCRMVNIDTDTGKEIVESFTVRIYKSGIRYVFAVHEEPSRPEGIRIATVEKSWFVIYHTGYSTSLMPKKSKRNLEIILSEFEKEQSEKRKYSYYCYLSDSYYALEEYEKCMESAKLYIEKAKEYNIVLLGLETIPYLNIIKCLEAKNSDQKEIEYWINQLEKKAPEYPDIYFMRARLSLKQRSYRATLANLQRAEELSDNYNGIDVNHIPSHMAEIYWVRGLCEEALLNIPDAITDYYKAFEINDEDVKSLFRLLSLVKKLPGPELDNFVDNLFSSSDRGRHVHVMAALMMNYMYEQLLRCYAQYKKKIGNDALDGQITAFLFASKGEYDKASSLFSQVYKVSEDKNAAIRSLICAFLSNDRNLMDMVSEAVPAGSLGALGVTEESSPQNNADDYANIYSELDHMGYGQKALALIRTLGDAGEEFLLKLAEALEGRYCFEAAFEAASLCPISGKALMLMGYYAYRMGRYAYARDCFDAAESEGCTEPGLPDLKKETETRIKMVADKKRSLNERIQDISTAIETNPAKALELIEGYKLLDADNPEINSAECVLRYQAGFYRDAAVNVLGALQRCGAVFDLHYNAYCIFEKLGEMGRAADHLRHAADLCRDEETRAQLLEEMHLLETK